MLTSYIAFMSKCPMEISQKEPTVCDRVVEFTISMFLNCSTCFARHTAHHQELKTVISASGFTYVFGCQPLWWLSHRSGWKPKMYVKPEAAITDFELLMMGSVSSETCWAIKKHWNNKFYYTVAYCWFFLWDLYYDARIHEHHAPWKYYLKLLRYYGYT
jgi:hypothetical protein